MRTESRSQRRELRRYRRLSVIVVATLLVLSGLLGMANTMQGPRLASAEINGQGAISRAGQRLVLHANQPVAHVDPAQIAITPAVPFTTTTSGSDVTVILDEMLRYDVEYSVTVGAKSLYSGASSTHTRSRPRTSRSMRSSATPAATPATSRIGSCATPCRAPSRAPTRSRPRASRSMR
jgi:hypothetical protein